jgi:16S rRNA (adenine1518-N6/adenine1519-N6)-dimethyltransferase
VSEDGKSVSEYDPTSPKQASELLKAHGLRAQKRLGQNFLIDRNTLNRIVRATEIAPDDPVLEIGGGLGALTLALAATGRPVTCIEIDRHLEPILSPLTAPYPNITLIYADFLRLDLPALLATAFGGRQGAVVANIPYYITTPILERLLANKGPLKRIVLLVQNEFALRMVAAPNTEDYGAMSVWVQYHARIELVGTVPRTVFLPPPEVDSAIIALTPQVPGTLPVRDEARFSHLVRAAFGQRRKTLVNALLRAPASFNLGFGMDDRDKVEALLQQAGIDGNRRGETLSPEEFARLANL